MSPAVRTLIGAGIALGLAGCAATHPAPVLNRPISPDSASTHSQVTPPTESAKPSPTVLAWVWPVQHPEAAIYSSVVKGIDFDIRHLQPVYAAADGVVSYVGDSIKSYGEMVVIKHGADYLSVYANNDKVLVREGQAVKRGEKIAQAGGQDHARWHFEVRYRGKPINPLEVLPPVTR